MLYETRRALLGFRLKLTFDESLNKDASCIFVDVSKTATVGSLMNNIVERFEIPHNSFLTVQNCKVLPSESVYVMLDVNSVKINGPSTSTTEVRETQSSDVPQTKNASQETKNLIPGNEGDVVDGKTKFPKPRAPKRPIREGIAATIKMLLEEEEMDRIGKECSGLSLSNDISKVQSTSHQETMNVDYDKAETTLQSEEFSDLTSDACSDLNIEKKKRKRKRKHAKNREQEDQPSTSTSFTEPIPVLRHNTNDIRRKHIRFDDANDEGLGTSVDEHVLVNMSQSSTNGEIHQQPSSTPSQLSQECLQQQKQQFYQKFYQQQNQLLECLQPQKEQLYQICQQQNESQQIQQQQLLEKRARLLQQSWNHVQQHLLHKQQFQNPSLALQQSVLGAQEQQERLLHHHQTFNWRMPPIIQNTLSGPNGKSTKTTESSQTGTLRGSELGQFGSEGGLKQSGTIPNPLDNQPDDKKISDQMSIMETDDVSSTEIQPGSKNQTPQKPSKSQVPASTTNATNVKSKSNYNQGELYQRPKSSLPSYNGRTSNDEDSDNPNSSFINLPRLSESENQEYKPKHERVEKELATLLMCKQLDTCMEYSVQFSNEKGKGSATKSPLLKDVQNSPISKSPSSQPNRIPKKSKTSKSIWQNVETEEKHENGFPEQMEASSDDCEFLRQVKLDGNRIRLRQANGTWTVLTPEIANAELPKLDVPKENQSIVFRIVYLNQNFIPTSSELLYGQIVTYRANTNKLAIDIPHQFVEAIVKDCGEEALPETLVPITGSTFEVDLSTLIEPKVIS